MTEIPSVDQVYQRFEEFMLHYRRTRDEQNTAHRRILDSEEYKRLQQMKKEADALETAIKQTNEYRRYQDLKKEASTQKKQIVDFTPVIAPIIKSKSEDSMRHKVTLPGIAQVTLQLKPLKHSSVLTHEVLLQCIGDYLRSKFPQENEDNIRAFTLELASVISTKQEELSRVSTIVCKWV